MSSDKERDYQVGRGKPPVHSRYPKGRSGNPSGRPKNKPQLPSIKTAIIKSLNATVMVHESGELRRITKFDATFIQLANKAASGHMPSVKLLMPILTQLAGEGTDAYNQVDMSNAKQRLAKLLGLNQQDPAQNQPLPKDRRTSGESD